MTGIIISIGSIMQFLPMPFIGRLSDKYNRKILVTFSMPVFMMGVFVFMIASPSTIYYAILGILIYFLGATINGLNSQFVVSESSEKSKGLMYSFMFFSFFLGSIGGSTLLILRPYYYDSKSYFLLYIGILAIEGIIYAILLTNKTQTKESISIIKRNRKEMNLWVSIFKTKTLRSILIFFTLDIFVYGTTLSIYNAGLVDFYHFNTENIAVLSIGMNITNMIFQIPAGRITDKLGNKKTLILSQICGLGFFTLNIITISFWINGITSILILLLFGQISFALSIVTFIPAEQIILTDLGKERKGEYYGIINFMRGVGYIPTGYIAGLMVENIGYMSPFIFSFIGVLVEIFFLLRYFHHHPYI
jgi:MFS family permease